jgi:hypothetical protein
MENASTSRPTPPDQSSPPAPVVPASPNGGGSATPPVPASSPSFGTSFPPIVLAGLIIADLTLGYWSTAYFRYGGGLSLGGKDVPQVIYYLMLVLAGVSLLSIFFVLKRRMLLALVGTAVVFIPLAFTARGVPSENSSFNSTQSKSVLGGSLLLRTERDQWKAVGLQNLLLSKDEDTKCGQNFIGCNATIFAYYGSNDTIEATIQGIDGAFKKAGWSGHGPTSDELEKALAWNKQQNLKPYDDVIMNYGIATNGKGVNASITFFNSDPKSFENEQIRKEVSDKYNSQYKLFYAVLVSGGPQ